MSDNLHTLETRPGALLAKLQPAQRRAINHKVAIDCAVARRSAARHSRGRMTPHIQRASGAMN
ncbi:hypothetical protein [Janthinobacterium sp. BJB401]|uniref:hypothetical protein n=1 Tax=Janthinobacterium sp. BJB401 TaxID=2745934 RepID=UPI001C3C8790|nr:hypothetical protein [Janthinobacterium sp. BJB401]